MCIMDDMYTFGQTLNPTDALRQIPRDQESQGLYMYAYNKLNKFIMEILLCI